MWLDENPYAGTADAGPQSDGTYVSPVTTAAPADAGGGGPASYGQAVLDVFKFGVGVWGQREAQKDMLDYRRWEATAQGVNPQGQPAAGQPVAAGLGISPSLLLIGGAALLAVLLVTRK